eukprot:364223-Chlamydomonas_euryale.AAC.4
MPPAAAARTPAGEQRGVVAVCVSGATLPRRPNACCCYCCENVCTAEATPCMAVAWLKQQHQVRHLSFRKHVACRVPLVVLSRIEMVRGPQTH